MKQLLAACLSCALAIVFCAVLGVILHVLVRAFSYGWGLL